MYFTPLEANLHTCGTVVIGGSWSILFILQQMSQTVHETCSAKLLRVMPTYIAVHLPLKPPPGFKSRLPQILTSIKFGPLRFARLRTVTTATSYTSLSLAECLDRSSRLWCTRPVGVKPPISSAPGHCADSTNSRALGLSKLPSAFLVSIYIWILEFHWNGDM